MSEQFCVVGSINMDLVVRVDRFPQPGETRGGQEFGTYPGGKGANQAVALARLGARVSMAGKLGDDVFGKSYLETFSRENVHHGLVEVESGSTGVAVIEVNQSGENHIIIVPGANGRMDRKYVDRHFKAISEAEYALFQLEIPTETTAYALERLKTSGCTTILDPAPAPESGLPQELLQHVDILTPNESETAALTGIAVTDRATAEQAGGRLLDLGISTVVIKAGASGAYIVDNDGLRTIAGFEVEVADTTAAGDAFNAGMAFALGNGAELAEAVRYGNAVGAMACTALGAQSAMPRAGEVQKLLEA